MTSEVGGTPNGRSKPDDAAKPLFSRGDLTAGLPARRAGTVLFGIESRTAKLRIRSRRALERYVGERAAARDEEAFLGALAEGRESHLRPSIRDLERHARDWAGIVASDPALRAAIAHRIAERHRFRRTDVPAIRAALGLDGAAVQDAYARLFGAPLTSIYADHLPVRDRLAWARSRWSGRIESVPPFWWAFALTLTETVGGGVLALPIALAGVGILPAVALLVVFGLVNLVTVGAMSEAIIRNGSIRYGTAYLGRLVEDLLGPAGRRLLSTALFAVGVVSVPAYIVGVAAALGGVTGIAAPVWIVGLGLVTLLILRRGALDATIAFAIIVGAANIALLVAISAIALGSGSGSGSAGASTPGHPVDASRISAGLVFGVLLGAYFGHTAAATAAKVVLARDPSGRSLLRGSVAAMAAAIALYVLVVVAVLRAVPPDLLAGSTGTALEPLARQTGPVVAILGGVFVVLAMGLASIISSLALYNQTLEVVLDRPALERRLRGRRWATWLAGAAPILAIFVVTTVLFELGAASFAGPIALLGTIGTPLVAGVFPALLVVAARRRGELPSAKGIPGIGRPIVAASVVIVFVAGSLVQGWLVAGDPGTILATTAVALAIVFLIVQAVRSGAFRPRAVLEVTAPERTGADRVGLVVEGVRAPIDSVTRGPETRADLPRVRELGVWSHRLTDDGDTVPVALAATTDSGERRDLGTTDGDGRLTAFLDGEAVTIVLRHLAGEAAS